jgi:hypothetical protein
MRSPLAAHGTAGAEDMSYASDKTGCSKPSTGYKGMSDELVRAIGELVAQRKQLASEAERQYAREVEDILRTKCRDPRRIEHLLDGLLDFGFDDSMVRLYKKLCRYYFQIDPEATVSYVNIYRELWDDEGESVKSGRKRK